MPGWAGTQSDVEDPPSKRKHTRAGVLVRQQILTIFIVRSTQRKNIDTVLGVNGRGVLHHFSTQTRSVVTGSGAGNQPKRAEIG